MTLVYEFLQYRTARLHKSVAIRTAGNGGSGQRSAVSLCRGHARLFRGTDNRAQPSHALDYAYGIHSSYLHVCFRVFCPSVADQAQKGLKGLQETTNPGALHKSGLRSTKSCAVEYFCCKLAYRFGVHKLVEPLWEQTLRSCAFMRRKRGLERHGYQCEGKLRRGELGSHCLAGVMIHRVQAPERRALWHGRRH
eukprot:2217224-Pleurochrysis_carterae.AAC.1